MFDSRLLKSIFSLFGIKISTYLIPLITLPYLVRVLEPSGYGKLAFSLAVVQYCVIIVGFGFELSATQKIAIDRENKSGNSLVFWNVLIARLILSIVCLLTLIIFFAINDRLSEVENTIFCAYGIVIGTALFPQFIFQGKEELGQVSVIRIFTQMLSVPLLFIFVKEPSDIHLSALISTIPTIITALMSFLIIFQKQWIQWEKPTFMTVWKELKDGWHVFLSVAYISIYTTTITVALGLLSGPVSVAIFSSAEKLIKAAKGLIYPLSTAFFPRISELVVSDKSAAKNMMFNLLKFQLGMTSIMAFIIYFFANEIVNILFGMNFSETTVVLKIMSVVPILVSISNILGVQVLVPLGYKKEFSRALLSAASMSIFILLPLCYYFSFIGAAITVVISESLVVFLMSYVVFKKYTKLGINKI